MAQVVKTTPFTPSGRLRGSYVYLLLAQNQPDTIFVKVGSSNDPIKRMQSLLGGCPVEPGYLSVASLPSREIAFQCERELRSQLISWHSHREWYLLTWADQPEFNAAIRRVFTALSSPSWRVHWEQRFSYRQIIAILSAHRAKQYHGKRARDEARRLAKLS